MTYANADRVKKILTEKGPVEDGKVEQYILMADNYINKDLVNTTEPILPIPSPPTIVIDLAISLACAFFYKYESGDTITAEQAMQDWKDYFTTKYRRPRFVISTGD
jgi:hypothetical protein